MDSGSLSEEDMITEINLTPLVDVSLVLVIIFMVVAPFVSHILKPLELPASEKAGLSEQNTIKVSVFPDGVLAIGSRVVEESKLSDELKREISLGNPPWALVRAGAEVPHGRVMKIVKIVKAAGIQRVGFATQQKKTIPARDTGTEENGFAPEEKPQ